MAKLDSLSQNIINNNSYADLFFMYKEWLDNDYPATAKRLLDLIEHKLLDEQVANGLFIRTFKNSKNSNTIDEVLNVNEQNLYLSEMVNNVVRIKNSNNPKDIKSYLESINDSVEQYTNLITNQAA